MTKYINLFVFIRLKRIKVYLLQEENKEENVLTRIHREIVVPENVHTPPPHMEGFSISGGILVPPSPLEFPNF